MPLQAIQTVVAIHATRLVACFDHAFSASILRTRVCYTAPSWGTSGASLGMDEVTAEASANPHAATSHMSHPSSIHLPTHPPTGSPHML